jgi:uncharacterized LabA/DUF88 family protein
MEKIMVFIDASNFYKGIKDLGLSGWKLTYLNFFEFCYSFLNKSEQRLIRIYYYDAPFKMEWDKKRYTAQQRFHSSLHKQSNLELRLGRLQGTYPDIYEKGIDSALSVDMIKFAYNNSYDVGIIISADGDYVPAVQLCKDMGKNIWNIVPSSLKSYHLSKACDRYFSFDAERIEKYQFASSTKS